MSPSNCKLCTGSQHDPLGNARSNALTDLVQRRHQRGEVLTRDADTFAAPMRPDARQNQRQENAADEYHRPGMVDYPSDHHPDTAYKESRHDYIDNGCDKRKE